MKMIVKKILISLIVLSQLNLHASINNLPSMSWQQQELESNIRIKVEKVLNSVIKESQFNMNIEMITSEPEVPKFNEPLNKEDDDSADALNDNLKKKQKELQRKKKELEKAKNKKSDALVKFNDDTPDETSNDSVVFSKFGLEAPLIDDFNDFQPSGKIVLTMGNNEDKKKIDSLKEKFADESKLLKDKILDLKSQVKSKPSPTEQIWKYNNSIDIFKNLKSVNILIRLSKGIPEVVKNKLEGYVKEIDFNLGKVKPVIKFEYTILKSDIDKPTDEQVFKEWLDYASRFSNVLAIILGVILLGLIGKLLIKSFFEHGKPSQSSGSFKMESADRENEEDDDSVDGGVGAGTTADQLSISGLNGVERFKIYIENTPKEAILLIKEWLASEEQRPKQALCALVQQLENTELRVIFDSINENEKAEWRSLLDKSLSSADLAAANDFISNQIVQSVIVPSAIEDPETYDLILKLKPEKVADMIKEDSETSAILMNALNLKVVDQVLSHCDESSRDSIVMKSLNVTTEQVKKGQEQLKSVLSKYVEDVELKPFVQKLLKLLPESQPAVEESIFKAIATNTSVSVYKDSARETFPALLIKDLPHALLKTILSSYSLKDKVSMLLSIDEPLKDHFMEIFAPVGTKANDLLSIEFESIESDESELFKLQENSASNWHHFVKYTRSEIKKDKQFTSEVDRLVLNWCDENYSAAATRPDLKVA